MFGESFERYVTGSNDWLTTYGLNNTVARDLAHPENLVSYAGQPYPDRYLSPNFYTGPELNAGYAAHINCEVPSKAAYLAVEGGTFNGFTIAGIGFDKVEQIWFRALTHYFNSAETFNQAYTDIIHAASDLYGPDDVWQVTLALRAVEMNMPQTFNGDFNGDGLVDAADYVSWRHGLGTDYSLGEYDRWRANFGLGTSASASQVSSVPEPTSIALIAIGLLAFSRRYKPADTRAGRNPEQKCRDGSSSYLRNSNHAVNSFRSSPCR